MRATSQTLDIEIYCYCGSYALMKLDPCVAFLAGFYGKNPECPGERPVRIACAGQQSAQGITIVYLMNYSILSLILSVLMKSTTRMLPEALVAGVHSPPFKHFLRIVP